MRIRLWRRRRALRAGSYSADAQMAVWEAQGRAGAVAAAGRLAEAACRGLSADAMEDEFLWGPSATSESMGKVAHDLGDVAFGIDMDLLDTPNAELWDWIDRARRWGNEEREWAAREEVWA